MLLKDVHPLNALSPIVVTLDGIEIAVKLVFLQPLKAKLPIVVNPVEGKVTEVSPVQPEKALVPIPTIFNLLNVISEGTPKNIFCGIEILVPLPVICIFPLVLLNASLLTVIVLFEIVMLLRDVHPLNALTPIVATLDGIVIVVKLVLLQPLKAKLPIVVSVDRVVIIWFVVVDCKLVQSWNALSPIFVTLFGIVIDGNNAHPLKELVPILVRLFGNVIEEVKFVQPWNELIPILVSVVSENTDLVLEREKA